MLNFDKRMERVLIKIFNLAMVLLVNYSIIYGQEAVRNITATHVALSSIRGENSKPGILSFTSEGEKPENPDIKIIGPQARYFSIASDKTVNTEGSDSIHLEVLFKPDFEFIGIAEAQLKVTLSKQVALTYSLRGLSTKALEGKNEPPLADVMQTLGYKVDLGWQTLANHLNSDLQGDELAQQLFIKKQAEKVEIIPLARYSPSFHLPFGYYLVDDTKPVLNEVGVLSGTKTYPEHQTLFPGLEKGTSSFDPGDAPFGLFTTSPSHVAYSEDKWNALLFPDHAEHACRIYEARDDQGIIIPGQYLVCFEEAANGDYQDYVFLLKNVMAHQ
ncbi:MAG: hypothetical protein HKN76_00490 [Saprospiraceae bacterium]|nr:hypothetical protein [Saprospiraceae bacterium]